MLSDDIVLKKCRIKHHSTCMHGYAGGVTLQACCLIGKGLGVVCGT